MCKAEMGASEISRSSDYSYQEEHLTNFFNEIGCRVIRLKSGLWHSNGARIFQPIEMRGPVELSPQEKKQLWDGGSLFLRYPGSIDDRGIPSYIYLVDDKNYDLDSLIGHHRKETRRSLRHCTVERVEISSLIEKGMDLVVDTYARQGRHLDEWGLNWWKRNFEVSERNPLFEAWAAFVGKELGAFRIDYTYRGGFYGDVLFNRQDLLKYQVMNALMFVSTREVIKRPDVEYVSYGIRATFGDTPSLNRFKESIGYRRIDIVEKIEIAPKILPLFRSDHFCRLGQLILGHYCEKSDKVKRVCAILDDIRAISVTK